ncbi:glycosyltransferase family protein [Actinoplanes sp. URMC 104]|uniref:glycosyltransferase family protein n=1 Tax=Actinoplanes sp. URMC 104 TaxID=3423409 RepID=UPI003F1D2C4D
MPPAVHLLTPSLTDTTVARGGITFYRGTAAALTAFGPVTAYELDAGEGGREPVPGVDIVRCPTAAGIADALAHRLQPSDRVVKFVGAAGLEDWRLDLWVGRLCRDRDGRAVYVDPDAPSRLALLADGVHLRSALRDYTAVVLFAGGSRAIHEYRRIAPVPCWHASAAITALALGDPPGPARSPEYDVMLVAAGHGARERRAGELLTAWLNRRPRLRVMLAGHWPADAVPWSGPLSRQPFTGAGLPALYHRSRFVVNLLRRDFGGYADTAAARVFETAWAGSCLITEPFPGLPNYLEPELECLVAESVADFVTAGDVPERRRLEIGARAQRRVVADAAAAARQLVDFLSGLTATRVLEPT